MDTIGLDLHKRESQLCVGHADGTITEQRIVTSRERFTAVLGHRPPARVGAHLEGLAGSPALAAELAPLLTLLPPLNATIAAADQRLAELEHTDSSVALLLTAPGIGAVTASALVATIDDVQRFTSAHQFEAYLGLVPGERSSGELRRIGPITKAGNRPARWLLVEAAWRILRSKDAAGAPLRGWARPIVARRGSRIAAVALPRRL